MSRREFIDSYLSKWASRKLVVFLVASVGLFTGHIDGGDWVVIAVSYISVEGTTKIVSEIYKAKAKTANEPMLE